MFVAILAGGGGTRLWPLSRQATPKQFLRLISEQTMLQATVERVLPIADPQHISVITSASYAEAVREQLPFVPADQIVGEPRPRNSALAIGLAACYAAHRDPDAILASIGSDHLIHDVALFRETLLAGAEAAASGDYLVTIGVTPTEPHTGYGYIRVGDEVFQKRKMAVKTVEGFQEKPDRETAQRYLDEGRYLWNTNYFVWKVRSILDAFERNAPDYAEGLHRIQRAIGTSEEPKVIQDVYERSRDEAIDPLILEKASNLLVVPASFDWSDVGSWSDLYQLAELYEENSVLHGEAHQHLAIDSRGCLIVPDGRLVVTIGLDDIVVVQTPDVTLVCPRDRAQEVKKAVAELQRRKQEHFL